MDAWRVLGGERWNPWNPWSPRSGGGAEFRMCFFFEVPDQKGTNSAKKFFFVFQQEMNPIEKPLIFRKYVCFFFAGGVGGNWKIQRKYSANISQEQTATEIFFLIIFF